MERDDWNYRDNRRYNSDRQDYDRRVDPDSYRGAYRFDTSSDHRNETTYDGFDRRGRGNDRDRDSDYGNQGRGYSGGNRGWSGNYQGSNNRDNYGRQGNDMYGGDRGGNRHWDEQYSPRSGGYGTRFGGGNFNDDYPRDNFGNSGGDNYGNMAGSLSFGYDGYNNSNPDEQRRYDPMTGRQSYHGYYSSRHPDFNTDRDRRQNDDSFRDLDRY